MTTLLSIPNLAVGLWFIILLIKGILELRTDVKAHLNGWRYVLIEGLTTIISPLLGYTLLGDSNTTESPNTDIAPMIFPSSMVNDIFLLYAVLVVAFWALKLNPSLLAQTSYLYTFYILVSTLMAITLFGALGAMGTPSNHNDSHLLMLFPVLGFPIMAIYINLFVFSYRLIWCTAIHKSYKEQNFQL
jgi:hypothetical protein